VAEVPAVPVADVPAVPVADAPAVPPLVPAVPPLVPALPVALVPAVPVPSPVPLPPQPTVIAIRPMRKRRVMGPPFFLLTGATTSRGARYRRLRYALSRRSVKSIAGRWNSYRCSQ